MPYGVVVMCVWCWARATEFLASPVLVGARPGAPVACQWVFRQGYHHPYHSSKIKDFIYNVQGGHKLQLDGFWGSSGQKKKKNTSRHHRDVCRFLHGTAGQLSWRGVVTGMVAVSAPPEAKPELPRRHVHARLAPSCLFPITISSPRSNANRRPSLLHLSARYYACKPLEGSSSLGSSQYRWIATSHGAKTALEELGGDEAADVGKGGVTATPLAQQASNVHAAARSSSSKLFPHLAVASVSGLCRIQD